jgi:isopropylmalate/homocitrate/citramalate synthase
MSNSSQWKSSQWWTSQYNFAPEVFATKKFQEYIEMHDVTLRDGEQTPGVVFSKEDKVDIALKLDAARVHRIEAGMPVVSEEDRLAIKQIVKDATFSKIFSFCRVRKEDIDASLDCGVSHIVMEIPALKERLKVMGMTIEDAASKAVEVIEYAKSHGLFVVFFPYDTTRSDFESISKMMKAGESAHADRLAVVDTMGASSPDGFADLVSKVRKIVKVPLEVHCHNSLGFGTANTIAGLGAGAKTAHVAVNGIGEGAGNVALEEVVVSLKIAYGIDVGIDIPKLYEASQVVEKYSKIPVPVNKPIFGKNLFRREGGIAVERYYKLPNLARELELFDSEWFGRKTEIVLGKKSGKYSILLALKDRGLTASEEQVKDLLDAVKKRSIETKGPVSPEEFDQLAKQVLH